MTTRYKITVEYDGTPYCGFQRQPNIELKSVAEMLEMAILKLSGEKIVIAASGRTDSGVHGVNQIVHFDLEKEFFAEKIASGLNHFLKKESVAVKICEIVDKKFHSRFSAKMRHYKYVIINRRAPLTFDKNRAHHVIGDLDIKAMQEGANYLLGKHDFTSFRDSDCQANSPIKNIEKLEITKNGEEITIQISAASFLQHMVRTITGTLIWAGLNKIKPEEIETILKAKDRTKAGPNAPACGLYFLKVDY